MQIRINVKGASRKKAAIAQMTCEYPDREMTAGEFLEETVRQNVREYNARKDAVEILRLFAQDSEQIEAHLEAGAASGKVSYGDPTDMRKADEDKAALALIDDFRKTRLGKIVLETPDED